MATSTLQTCDHSAAKCVESDTDGDQFTEKYECPCGATGTITGDETKPAHTWTRTGRVFA